MHHDLINKQIPPAQRVGKLARKWSFWGSQPLEADRGWYNSSVEKAHNFWGTKRNSIRLHLIVLGRANSNEGTKIESLFGFLIILSVSRALGKNGCRFFLSHHLLCQQDCEPPEGRSQVSSPVLSPQPGEERKRVYAFPQQSCPGDAQLQWQWLWNSLGILPMQMDLGNLNVEDAKKVAVDLGNGVPGNLPLSSRTTMASQGAFWGSLSSLSPH